MSWMVSVAVVVAAMVSLVNSDAGHFFAETPKHLPRIGRRGDLPPLVNLLSDDDTRGSSGGATGGTMIEALAKADGDGDGCISLPELLRIPIIRIAVLLQNPGLIIPQVDVEAAAATENGAQYTSDHRPEPRLLRYLK